MLIETKVFRLAEGVSESAFLEADRRVQQEVIPNAEGFVRRTTARACDDDGAWMVVTLWGDAAACDAQPAQSELEALMAPGSLEVRRFTTLD